MSGIDIIHRLRFDAVRCATQFSKGVAGNISEAADEIEQLREANHHYRDAADEARKLREQLVCARNDAIQECIAVCNEFDDTSPTFIASKLFDMTLTDD